MICHQAQKPAKTNLQLNEYGLSCSAQREVPRMSAGNVSDEGLSTPGGRAALMPASKTIKAC